MNSRKPVLSRYRLQLFVLAIFIFLTVVLWVVVNPVKANINNATNAVTSAWANGNGLSNLSPNPGTYKLYTNGSVGGSSSSLGFKHLLKNERSSQIRRIKLAVYYETRPTAATVRVTVEGNSCAFGPVSNQRVGYIIGGSNQSTPANNGNEAAACSFLNKTIPIPQSAFQDDGISGLYKANLEFYLDGSNYTVQDGQRNQVRFRVQAQGSGIVSPVGNARSTEFGIVENFGQTNHSILGAIPFGVPCNGPNELRNQPISLYDPDPPTFGQMQVFVMKREKLADGTLGAPVRLTQSEYSAGGNVSWRSAGYFVTTGGDNQNSSIIVKLLKKEWKYMLVVANENQPGRQGPTGNVLSISVPTDPITGVVNCEETTPGTLTPHANLGPNNYSYYPKLDGSGWITGDPLMDRWTVPNPDQEYSREHRWDVYEVKFSDFPGNVAPNSNVDGCAPIASAGPEISGSCKSRYQGVYSDSNRDGRDISHSKATPDPIGTWTCFITRVLENPEPSQELQDDIQRYVNDWNDSDRSPQGPWIDGGYNNASGSRIGGFKNFNTLYAPYKNRVATATPRFKYSGFACSLSGIDPKIQVHSHDVKVGGGINTYLRDIPVGPYAAHYGSWGEYGVLSNGGNASMASGVGINWGTGSNQQSDWSDLTFANSSGFGNFGGVTGFIPNEDHAEVMNGDRSFGGNISGKRVIKVNGNVTITSNLTYGNNYNSIGQIPRIVIIADGFTINGNVEEIDPWLITTGTVKTCNEEEPLSTGVCSRPLRFNGPVVAGEIILYRTGGSRDGSKENLSRQAEIFNLRPDAFLSAYAGSGTRRPVAITDKVTELPPRF